MKYEGVRILEDVIRIAEKKEASLESTSILSPKDKKIIHPTSLQALFSTNTLHLSNITSRMEATMEQLMSKMTKHSVHLLQSRAFRNPEGDSNKVQCYTCKKIDHISRVYPNRDAKGRPSLRRVTFVDDKYKVHVNLIEMQDEIRKKAIGKF